jgi:hypothetical protein
VTWSWLALSCGIPLAAALAVTIVVRGLTNDAVIANALGAAAALIAVLALFALEFVSLSRMHAACAAAGQYCPVFPGDFRQYSVIGLGGFVDIGLMYAITLKFDEWRRRRRV